MSQPEKNTANQPDFPVTERVREALAVTQRGVDELLPVSRRQLQVVRQALGEP